MIIRQDENGYDPVTHRIYLTLSTKLFDKYYANFEGLLENSEFSKSKGASLDRLDNETARLYVPIDEKDVVEKGDMKAVAVDIQPLAEILRNFVESAIRKELKRTNFIPLSGYSITDLQKEMKLSIKNNYRFCIIKEFDVLKKDVNLNSEFTFEQYLVDYGSDEYCDTVLDIMSGNLKNARKRLLPMLKKESWINT